MSAEKKPPKEKEYVEISQDSIGRLFFKTTPNHVSGLCTLTTHRSQIIIIKGDTGIGVIHTTGIISNAAIANEFSLYGKIKKWTVYDYYLEYPFDLDSERFDFINYLAPEVAKKKHTAQSRLAKFCVDLHGNVDGDKEPYSLSRTTHQRNFINFFNLRFNEALLPEDSHYVDVQFDGAHFTPCPPLRYTAEKMYAALMTHLNHRSEFFREEAYLLLAYLLTYLRLFDKPQFDIISKKEGTRITEVLAKREQEKKDKAEAAEILKEIREIPQLPGHQFFAVTGPDDEENEEDRIEFEFDPPPSKQTSSRPSASKRGQ